jgi:predicted nucleic acid-binding protein
LADPVYFDSSVFLAIFMGEASGPAIRELLKELRRDKVRIYTSIITVQEVSVQTFRKGAQATDNYSKVSKLSRIEGITKDIALEAAKIEAQIIDQMKAKDREDNKRRKWDCFHIATAMALGCRSFFALDEKLLNRGRQLNITSMAFGKPVPRSLPLFKDTDAGIEVRADDNTTKEPTKSNGKGIQQAANPSELRADSGSGTGNAPGAPESSEEKKSKKG